METGLTLFLEEKFQTWMQSDRCSAPMERGVSGDIGDCGIGITLQKFNRVTIHGDICTFSKQASWEVDM